MDDWRHRVQACVPKRWKPCGRSKTEVANSLPTVPVWELGKGHLLWNPVHKHRSAGVGRILPRLRHCVLRRVGVIEATRTLSADFLPERGRQIGLGTATIRGLRMGPRTIRRATVGRTPAQTPPTRGGAGSNRGAPARRARTRPALVLAFD